MIRVVHLHCSPASYETSRGIAHLTRVEDDRYKAIALTIGRGGDFRGPITAAASLRLGHGFDVIHAWDAPSFFAAIASGVPVIYSPAETVKAGTWSWLATSSYTDVQVVSSSEWACARQIEAGLSDPRCHTILPALDPCIFSASPTKHLRQELGIADDEFVILAPGESTGAANHRTAWHAAAILGVLTSKCRLLLWGRGREARSIRELSLRAKLPNLVIDAEHTLRRQIAFEELLPVADAALVTAKPQASLLPIAACAAAGLPIVAIDNPVIREIFGGASVSRLPPKDVRTLSQRLLELSENPGLRQTMGATAAVTARQKFDPQRFECDQIALCQRLLAIHPHQPESAQPATSSQPAPAH